MKVLVTGAAGRLGRATCPILQSAGMEVRATDRRTDPTVPYQIEVATLLDRERCYALVEGVDAIVHLGNWASAGSADAQTVFNENCSMNMNVFQAAMERGVRRIIFASTIQVILGQRPFGGIDAPVPQSDYPYLPLDGNTPANICNPYAASKSASEQLLHYFSRWHGTNAVAIRFPMLLTPSHYAHIAKTLDQVWQGYNLDEAFTYLTFEDAAGLMLASLRADLAGYRVYQPAARSPWVMLSAAEIVTRFFDGVRLHRPLHEIESIVDLSKIEAETGWCPQDEIVGPRASVAV
jgi:nucleoside-diphosphate-sugar epimerase